MPNNQIAVRVRSPKSEAERARYSLQNCALEAKLMREGPPTPSNKTSASGNDAIASSNSCGNSNTAKITEVKKALKSIAIDDNNAPSDDGDDDDGSESSDDSSVAVSGRKNPFSVLG